MRTLLVVHCLGPISPDVQVILRTKQTGNRYLRMPADPCMDCPATVCPQTIPVEEPYSAAVAVQHAPTCPVMLAALRRWGGDQP